MSQTYNYFKSIFIIYFNDLKLWGLHLFFFFFIRISYSKPLNKLTYNVLLFKSEKYDICERVFVRNNNYPYILRRCICAVCVYVRLVLWRVFYCKVSLVGRVQSSGRHNDYRVYDKKIGLPSWGRPTLNTIIIG